MRPRTSGFLTIGLVVGVSSFQPLDAQDDTTTKKPPEAWQIAGIRAAFGDSREPFVEPSPAVQREALKLCALRGWGAALNPQEVAVYLSNAKDPALCSASITALGQMGSAAAPFAKQMADFIYHTLSSPNHLEYNEAIGAGGAALAQFAKDGTNLDDVLGPLLKNPESKAQELALFTIGNTGRNGGRFAKDVAAFLRNKSPTLQLDAAYALGEIGEPAISFAPDVSALLSARKWQVREGAAVALCKIGNPGSPYAKQIVDLLEEEPMAKRGDYRDAVAQLGKADASVAAMVAAKLNNIDPNTYGAAAVVLSGMGKNGAPFAKAVAALLDDHDERVANAAADALAKMFSEDATVKKDAEARLESSEAVTRSAAMRALIQMGEPSASLADKIVTFLEDSEAQTRIAALLSLGKMGAAGRKYADRIGALLYDSDRNIQTAAVESLGQMEHAGAAFAAEIATLLESDNHVVRTAAWLALGKLGKTDATIPSLVAARLEANRDARFAATNALSAMGPNAASAARDVAKLLDDDDPLVRGSAILTLGKIGEAGRAYAKEVAELIGGPETPEFPVETCITLVLDQWGNPEGNWDLQCILLSKVDGVAHAKIPEWRAHLRLWAGSNAEMQRSVTWLGHPDLEPLPKEGLSAQETRATLSLFAKLWEHSDGKMALHNELTERITQVARAITAKPEAETLAILQDLAKKVPDIPDWQQARKALDEAIRK